MTDIMIAQSKLGNWATTQQLYNMQFYLKNLSYLFHVMN